MTFASRRGRVEPPNLDDRTWQDLVDEMRALIPRYAPEWTDHNPSDLGITLIELFAALVEGVIYRLNQVPDKNYLALLELLGVTRDPATPAHTPLTFTSGTGTVLVPAGTQAQTAAQDGAPPVVFETDADVTVLPTVLAAALVIGPHPVGAAAGTYDNVSSALVGPPTANCLLQIPPGQRAQICLGFDKRVPEDIVLGLRHYQPLPDAAPAGLEWVCSTGALEPLAWSGVRAVADGTDSLRHDGTVRLSPAVGWAAQRAAGPPATSPWTTVTPRDPADAVTDPLFWLGLRISHKGADPAPPLVIGIDRLLFNAAEARTALTVATPEVLGESTGEPFQTFPLARRPLYRRSGSGTPFDHLVVEVGEEIWTQVEHLPPGGSTAYRVDPVVGEIRFGDFDPTAPRSQGHGLVPPRGTRIRALRYRYVASGARGNVPPKQVTVPGPTPAGALPTGITAVANLGPGRDGVDEEAIEDTLRRAPEALRTGDRAVTVGDYDFLVREAGTNIGVERCLTPRLQAADYAGPGTSAWLKGDPWTFAGILRAPGSVNVIIVPDQGPDVARPEPTQEQLRQVRAYLGPRCDLTAQLAVHGPRYLPVIVKVDVVVWQDAVDAGVSETQVKDDTLRAIRAFLHPTRGGPAGAGWAIGQSVLAADLFRAISPPDDVGYIALLQVQADVPVYHFPPLNPAGTAANYDQDRERPFRLTPPAPADPFGASVRVADYELVCCAADDKHAIRTLRQQV